MATMTSKLDGTAIAAMICDESPCDGSPCEGSPCEGSPCEGSPCSEVDEVVVAKGLLCVCIDGPLGSGVVAVVDVESAGVVDADPAEAPPVELAAAVCPPVLAAAESVVCAMKVEGF